MKHNSMIGKHVAKPPVTKYFPPTSKVQGSAAAGAGQAQAWAPMVDWNAIPDASKVR